MRTFEAASFLKRKGADTVIAKTLLQNDIETYAARSEAVTNAEFYDNTIAISLYENHTENAAMRFFFSVGNTVPVNYKDDYACI